MEQLIIVLYAVAVIACCMSAAMTLNRRNWLMLIISLILAMANMFGLLWYLKFIQ